MHELRRAFFENKVVMKIQRDRFYHIMFLPIVGEVDKSLIFNVITVLIFLGIYFWHTHHDHKHNKELLDEVKKIREKLEKK